jgi:hypothetical protein
VLRDVLGYRAGEVTEMFGRDAIAAFLRAAEERRGAPMRVVATRMLPQPRQNSRPSRAEFEKRLRRHAITVEATSDRTFDFRSDHERLFHPGNQDGAASRV